MDGRHFDDLSRNLATSTSRRTALKGAAAALLAALGLRAHTGAQSVTQAYCGNQTCLNNVCACKPGCVCCVYSNRNSRCRPPGQCSPGTESVCAPPTTTTAAPTTTSTTSTSTSTTTTTTTTTSTTTAAPTCVEDACTNDGLPCCDPNEVCVAGNCASRGTEGGACDTGQDDDCAGDLVCCANLSGTGPDNICRNLSGDPDNCGDCNVTCPGSTPACVGGGCVECAAPSDCPAPNQSLCQASVVCTANECVYIAAADNESCGTGQICCNETCISNSEPLDCGTCGNVCAGFGDPDLCEGAAVCTMGVCDFENALEGSICGRQDEECKVPDTCSADGVCLDNGFIEDGTGCTSGQCCNGECCPSSARYCNPSTSSGTCVECYGQGGGVIECPDEVCDTESNTCVECVAASDCPIPENFCEQATCAGNTCGVENKPNTTSCDDGQFCTTGTTCTDGICGGGTLTCDPDACLTCDEMSDTCVTLCTANQTCNQGDCTCPNVTCGETCCAPGQVCSGGVCAEPATTTTTTTRSPQGICQTGDDACVGVPERCESSGTSTCYCHQNAITAGTFCGAANVGGCFDCTSDASCAGFGVGSQCVNVGTGGNNCGAGCPSTAGRFCMPACPNPA